MNKYESVFNNPQGFTQQEIAQFRMKVIAFNKALTGRRLAIPLSDDLDLSYKDKVTGRKPGLYLGIPMKKYMIETVDLWDVDIRKNANDKVVIVFNKDEKLTFDLRMDIDEVLKATPQDVHEAIKNYEATGEKKFFWNVRMVNDVVTSLNQQNLKDLTAFIDELATQGASLESLNKLNKDDVNAYYDSIGE